MDNLNSRPRAEVYNVIKTLGLQKAVFNKFKKHYTQCKTVDLEQFIGELAKKEVAKNDYVKATLVEMIFALVRVLKDKHILLDSEVKKILSK